MFKENNLIRNYFEAGEGRYCKENFYEVWEKNLYLNWSHINVIKESEPVKKEKESKENIKFSVSELSLSKLPLVSIAISTFESGGKGHELLKHNFDQIFK